MHFSAVSNRQSVNRSRPYSFRFEVFFMLRKPSQINERVINAIWTSYVTHAMQTLQTDFDEVRNQGDMMMFVWKKLESFADADFFPLFSRSQEPMIWMLSSVKNPEYMVEPCDADHMVILATSLAEHETATVVHWVQKISRAEFCNMQTENCVVINVSP